MRRQAAALLAVLLPLAGAGVSDAQVIALPARRAADRAPREEPDPQRWSPALRLAWDCSQRVEADEGAAFAVRAAICELLADQGLLRQAMAAAGRMKGLRRHLADAGLALQAARQGERDLAKKLYLEARQGCHFTDTAGAWQIQAALAGAASALGWQEELERLLKQTSDPEHRATALGAALAESEGRPATHPPTQALLDELISEEQEKLLVSRLYQSRALLRVAKSWRQSPAGLDNDLFTALCRRAVRFADNKLIDATGLLVETAEACHDAGLSREAEAMLGKAREMAGAGGGFERGPADLIDLARVWRRVTGEDISAELGAAAWSLLEALDPVLKVEAAALAGGAFWRLGDSASAWKAWRKAASVVAKNPNADWVHETLARIAIEAARCGADRDEAWAGMAAKIESEAGLSGKEDA